MIQLHKYGDLQKRIAETLALEMMTEKEDSYSCVNNMRFPFCVFFKDARYYFE